MNHEETRYRWPMACVFLISIGLLYSLQGRNVMKIKFRQSGKNRQK